MVGVPGKSKGCITCRRRKVRCDAEKPNCTRCVKSNRTCEGYEKFPVFLNRTSTGLSKRKRLEEARPRAFDFEHVMSDAHPSETDVDSEGSGRELQRRPGRSAFFPVIIADGAMNAQQLLSSFLEAYLPSGPVRNMVPKYQWFPRVIDMSYRSPALESSLQAFTLTRMGWMYGDESLSMRGRRAYGSALKHLQKALWDSNHMGTDETLAAGRLLAIYELYESTTNSIQGWNNHESGIARMIKLRGPNGWQSPMGKALFEDSRNSMMVQSIQFRKTSFFEDEIWTYAPWSGCEKDDEQRLLDHGFRIANMLATIDSAKEEMGGIVDADRCVLIFNQSIALDRDLNRWMASYKTSQPGPLYWQSPPQEYSDALGNSGMQDPRGHPGYTFADLRVANIMIVYWTMRILVSLVIHTVSTSMDRSSEALTPGSSSSLGNSSGSTSSSSAASDPSLAETASSLASFLSRKHPPSERLDMARRILRSIDYLTRADMGLFGAQRSIFPFRVALAIFRTHKDFFPGVEDELDVCVRKYALLTDVKGLGYARDIGRESGKWQQGS